MRPASEGLPVAQKLHPRSWFLLLLLPGPVQGIHQEREKAKSQGTFQEAAGEAAAGGGPPRAT